VTARITPRARAPHHSRGRPQHAPAAAPRSPAHPVPPPPAPPKKPTQLPPNHHPQQAWQTIPGLAAVVICLTAGGLIREGVAHVYWGKPRPGALDSFTKALVARDVGVLEERARAAEMAEAEASK
jgi:hypothetical protein